MHLVQILLPTFDNDGAKLSPALFEDTRRELTEHFGGMTAYSRSPGVGLWKDEPNHTTRDEIIIYEVMVESLDPRWWKKYRPVLERRFAQEELVIRAHEIQLL